MRLRILLTRKRFEEWVKVQPTNMSLGISHRSHQDPLGNYLAEVGGFSNVDVGGNPKEGYQLTYFPPLMGRTARLPKWAARLEEGFDELGSGKFITVEHTLSLLGKS